MALTVQHVHLKAHDVQKTIQYYTDNFGATMKAEIPGRGFQLDLHGLQLNVTGIIAEQNHEQHYGIEHMAVVTDDFTATLSKLRENGVAFTEHPYEYLEHGGAQHSAEVLDLDPLRWSRRW